MVEGRFYGEMEGMQDPIRLLLPRPRRLLMVGLLAMLAFCLLHLSIAASMNIGLFSWFSIAVGDRMGKSCSWAGCIVVPVGSQPADRLSVVRLLSKQVPHSIIAPQHVAGRDFHGVNENSLEGPHAGGEIDHAPAHHQLLRA